MRVVVVWGIESQFHPAGQNGYSGSWAHNGEEYESYSNDSPSVLISNNCTMYSLGTVH